MVVILMNFFLLVVAMDDLDFGIRDVAFEVKLSLNMAPFNLIKLQI
jgi:hypothetical protein